ncbi:hypothetical protein [Flavobacterium sp.]|nr:hypothetical protein [Flavobacterium sp.]
MKNLKLAQTPPSTTRPGTKPNPNYPSKNHGQPSGPRRGNTPKSK